MKPKKFLVLYKKTAYSVYKGKNIIDAVGKTALLKSERGRLVKAHDEHHRTFDSVRNTLKEFDVNFQTYYRERHIPFDQFDVIMTVGGDGTFLKASSFVGKQLMIGINSATSFSVGRLCTANIKNFPSILADVIKGKHKVKNLQRLGIKVTGQRKIIQVLNDILIAHSNPAVLSRYSMTIGGRREEQRSSGIWVSTAVGSSGAIGSAGGKLLDPFIKKYQYLPRELYQGLGKKYKFIGGVLGAAKELKIVSLMPKGKVYIDGGQHSVNFSYGKEINITLSNKPIRTLII